MRGTRGGFLIGAIVDLWHVVQAKTASRRLNEFAKLRNCLSCFQATYRTCTSSFIVAEVLATFVVLGHFHKLLAQAELLLVGQQLESFDGDLFESAADIARAEEPEDKAAREVGAPESANSFRIQNRKRQKKAREWLANAQEQQKLLIWACVARPTLTLHYELLKHGSIKAMTTDERPSMWTAVRMKDSVAVRVLCQLSLCFDTSSTKCDETWGIVIDLHGGFDDWGHQLSKLATWSAHRVAGQLWRRFIVRLRTWRWRLAGVVDVKLSWDARMQIAQDFMDCAECCLDEFWGQKFRKFLKEPADLFLEPIQRFLLAVFYACGCEHISLRERFRAFPRIPQ